MKATRLGVAAMKFPHLLSIVLVVALAPVHADSLATQTMVLTVRPVVSLSVTKTGAIALEATVPGDASRYQAVKLVQAQGLRVYQNLSGTRRVQAEATIAGDPNDMDLTCATTGQAGATLIKRGVGQGPQAITGEVTPGLHLYDLIWEAQATGPGTPAGQYECEIRFTMTEN